MNTQKLIEALNNYKYCYREAKLYTSYKNIEDAESQFIVRELYEKSWKYKDAKFPVVLIGLFILFIYLLIADSLVTNRNTIIDVCVLFLLLIGGILVELDLNYWMNKYKMLAKNLEKAEHILESAEREYKNTLREYNGGDPIYKSYITLL